MGKPDVGVFPVPFCCVLHRSVHCLFAGVVVEVLALPLQEEKEIK